jgi:hypothetical protein
MVDAWTQIDLVTSYLHWMDMMVYISDDRLPFKIDDSTYHFPSTGPYIISTTFSKEQLNLPIVFTSY